MIFNKTTRKSRQKGKLTILFFQVPDEIILAKIRSYLAHQKYSQLEYFCDQKIPLIAHYGGKTNQFADSFNIKPAYELIVIGYPTKGEVSQDLLITLKLSGAIIKLIPVDLNLFSGLLKIDNFNDLPHIRLFPGKISIIHRIFKEILTKSAAISGILITFILFPFIAVLIKLTSPGPVFYKQKRLGKNARPFTLYKFRTMGVSAEQNGPQLSGNEDKRITRGGKTLRYYHLDELPQFWNLLKGDMALVGPRPERPFFARFLAHEIPYYKIIYQQKPGLTSLGMIKYGYASSIEEMTDRLYYDIVYLNNPSFWMDIKILLKTIRYIILKTFYDPSHDRNIQRDGNLKSLKESHDPLVRWLSLKKKDMDKSKSS